MGRFLNWYFGKKDYEQQQQIYLKWAYPFGEKQKEKINEIINQVLPDEDQQFARYYYLVAKQKVVPEDYNEDFKIDDSIYPEIYEELKKSFSKSAKKQIHKYLALVEADYSVDENLNYPSIEDIENRSEKIKEILAK